MKVLRSGSGACREDGKDRQSEQGAACLDEEQA